MKHAVKTTVLRLSVWYYVEKKLFVRSYIRYINVPNTKIQSNHACMKKREVELLGYPFYRQVKACTLLLNTEMFKCVHYRYYYYI